MHRFDRLVGGGLVLLLAACTNHLVGPVPADASMRAEAGKLPFGLLAKAGEASELAYHGEDAIVAAYRLTHTVTFLPQDGERSYDALFLATPKQPCRSLDDPEVRAGDIGGIQVLAFRGTADVSDLISDVAPGEQFITGTSIRMHPGFLENAREALHDIGATVIAKIQAGCPLLLAGHSKGGATALAAFVLLAVERNVPPDRMLVITFGQPLATTRVEGPLGDRVLRVIHTRDAIPALPPASRTQFRHVGVAVYLWDDPNTWSVLPRERTENEWWDAKKAAEMFDKARTNGFADHDKVNYRDRTESLKLSDLAPYDPDKRYPKD